MAKQPIAWHEGNLKNFEANVQRHIKEAEKAKRLADLMVEEVEFRKKQIEAAKAKKKDGFDCEKFFQEEAPKVRYWQAYTFP
jgi:hypothetical protein